MSGLKDMSVDELRATISMPDPNGSGWESHARAFLAFDEMARRLREREQQYATLKRTVEFQEEQYLQTHGGNWGECKYQSSLLACQAREAELREAIQDLKNIPVHQPGGAPSCLVSDAVDRILSHSTGSKIVAVVEAAKVGHYELAKGHCGCGLCTALRVLEK